MREVFGDRLGAPGACHTTARSAKMRLKTATIVGRSGGEGVADPPPPMTSRTSLAPRPIRGIS